MIINAIVAVAQITVILLVAWSLARYWRQRDPRVVVPLAITGLMLGTVIATCTALSIPRPLVFRVPSYLSQTEAKEVAWEVPVKPQNDTGLRTDSSEKQSPGWRLPFERWLRVLAAQDAVSQQPFPTFTGTLWLMLGGLLWQLGIVIVGTIELLRLKRAGHKINEGRETALLLQLCQLMKRRKVPTPQLRENPLVAHACTSWLEPCVIYLPSHFRTWSDIEMEAALAHELEHLERGDGFWRYWSRLCTGLLWCHPFAWEVHRELCLAQEMNADQRARKALAPGSYLRGLALLALRMDASTGRVPWFGVSVVTTDLIRRIEMLRKPESKSSPRHRQIAIASVAMMAAVAMTCLTWTIEAQEPLLVAKLPDSKNPAPTRFSRAPLSPWESLPADEGYAAVRFQELSQLPYVQPWIPQANAMLRMGWAAIGADPTQLSDHGITVENLRLGQTCVKVVLSHTKSESVNASDEASEQVREKEEHTVALSANHLVLDTHVPIAWTSIIPMLNVDTLSALIGPASQPIVQAVFDKLLSAAKDSSHLVLCNEPVAGDKVAKAAMAAWQAVDGGVITVALDIQATVKGVLNEGIHASKTFSSVELTSTRVSEPSDAPQLPVIDATEREALAFLSMVQWVGIGFDEGSSPKEATVRLVWVPVADKSTTDLIAQWERLTREAKTALQDQPSSPEADIARRLFEMEMRIFKADASQPELLRLEGSIALP